MQNDGCRVTRCGTTEIRFPFHLKERDEQHKKKDQCVFPPGFQLSCNGHNFTVMEFNYQVNTTLPSVYLSFAVKAYVQSIDYRSRKLLFLVASQDIRQHFHYSHNHGRHRPDSYLSDSPFKHFTLTKPPVKKYSLYTPYFNKFTFYNCSSTNRETYGPGYSALILTDFPSVELRIIDAVTSLRSNHYEVYAVYSDMDFVETGLKSCTKMYDISDVPYNTGRLTWSGPNCGHCEAKGKYCKFKTNSTTLTQCYLKGKPSNFTL